MSYTYFTPNAASVAQSMRQRVPDASEAEVTAAARAFARSLGGQWAEPCPASDTWVAAVSCNWRLDGPDELVF